VNKKLLLITLAGLTGTLFLSLLLFQSMVEFQSWNQVNYLLTFIFMFLALGLLYTSKSFPAFRSNTKTLAFLMLPATNSEKFAFELLTRIVSYIIIMPVLFWAVANIEGTIVHQFVPQLTNYKFSVADTVNILLNKSELGFWGIYGSAQAMLFVFTAAFAGASHFSKSPLIKTLFSFSTIVTGYFLYSYLLYRGLNMKNYESMEHNVVITKKGILVFFALAGTVVNLALLAIAWFRLKEKEA
jgi:hypothetical protein